MCFGFGTSDTYYHEEIKPARPYSGHHHTHHWHHSSTHHGHHHHHGHHSHSHHHGHHHHHHHHGSHTSSSSSTTYSPRASYIPVASSNPRRSGPQVVYATREREEYTY